MGAKKNRNNKLRERVTPIVKTPKKIKLPKKEPTNNLKPTSLEKTIAHQKKVERKRELHALRTSKETARISAS